MARELLIHAGVGETRIALCADGHLDELILERDFDGRANLAGDIYLGKVHKVMTGMQAAFVEIGQARPGFLALREAMILSRDGRQDISACVREGEAVLVQAVKEPIGDKGARLSAAVNLPGRLLVMTPGRRGISLSRRIDADEVRKKLTALGEAVQAAAPDAGFILRTQAAEASREDLLAEACALRDIWSGIETARHTAKAPAILHRELGPIERSLRELARDDVERIAIDDAAAVEAARDFCRRALPGVEGRIVHAAAPLFHDALEDEIAALASPRVPLPSGGWITIEATEALTAIDVNSGRFTQSSGLEETSLATDLEAAREIGRQLRLRAIGGLIVIDFIHLHRAGHAEQVLAALDESLALGRAPVQISSMSEFGIVAVTRKRIHESLARILTEPCSACAGAGRRASPQSVALELLRRVEREARANPGREIIASAAPMVTAWLTAHDDEVRAGLSRRGVARVRFEADNAKAREHFDVRAQ